MNFARLSKPQRVSAIAVAVVAVAAFLPWVSLLGFTKIGIRGDGAITLIAAVLGAVILSVSAGVVGARDGQPRRRSRVILLVLAIVVTLIGLVDMNGVAAIGLYLTLFGGIAWVVGAVWDLSVSRTSAETGSGATVEDDAELAR